MPPTDAAPAPISLAAPACARRPPAAQRSRPIAPPPRRRGSRRRARPSPATARTSWPRRTRGRRRILWRGATGGWSSQAPVVGAYATDSRDRTPPPPRERDESPHRRDQPHRTPTNRRAAPVRSPARASEAARRLALGVGGRFLVRGFGRAPQRDRRLERTLVALGRVGVLVRDVDAAAQRPGAVARQVAREVALGHRPPRPRAQDRAADAHRQVVLLVRADVALQPDRKSTRLNSSHH